MLRFYPLPKTPRQLLGTARKIHRTAPHWTAMFRIQWSLAGLFSVVLFAAIACGTYVALWSFNHPNANFLLAVYLLVLVTATLGAIWGRPRLRRSFIGYAAFGWCYLVFVLKFAIPLATIDDAQRVADLSQLGVGLGLLAAIAATWVMPRWKEKQSDAAPRS